MDIKKILVTSLLSVMTSTSLYSADNGKAILLYKHSAIQSNWLDLSKNLHLSKAAEINNGNTINGSAVESSGNIINSQDFVPPVVNENGETVIVGSSCDDGNNETSNDVWTSEGTCVGVASVIEISGGTVSCLKATTGTTVNENGTDYYIASGVADIQNKITNGFIANNICTSHVTNMANLFKNNTTFNQNISSWDTAYVANMESMFENATSFNQDISNWNVWAYKLSISKISETDEQVQFTISLRESQEGNVIVFNTFGVVILQSGDSSSTIVTADKPTSDIAKIKISNVLSLDESKYLGLSFDEGSPIDGTVKSPLGN